MHLEWDNAWILSIHNRFCWEHGEARIFSLCPGSVRCNAVQAVGRACPTRTNQALPLSWEKLGIQGQPVPGAQNYRRVGNIWHGPENNREASRNHPGKGALSSPVVQETRNIHISHRMKLGAYCIPGSNMNLKGVQNRRNCRR